MHGVHKHVPVLRHKIQISEWPELVFRHEKQKSINNKQEKVLMIQK